MHAFSTRLSRLALVALASFGIAACDDDPTEPAHEEPEVATVRLVAVRAGGAADTALINVNTGVVTSSDNALVVGDTGNTVLTATYLDATGAPDEAIAEHSDEFELRFLASFISTATGTTPTVFTRTITTTGGANATPRDAMFELFHLGENHEEFAIAVPVVVQ